MATFAPFTETLLRVKYRNQWGTDCALEDLIQKRATTFTDEFIESIQNRLCQWTDELPSDAASLCHDMKQIVDARKTQAGSFSIKRQPWCVGETNVLVGLHAEAMAVVKTQGHGPAIITSTYIISVIHYTKLLRVTVSILYCRQKHLGQDSSGRLA